MGFLPPVASRSWHRCIAYSAVLLVEGLLCHSPACRLAYLSTSEVVPPSLVLHARNAGEETTNRRHGRVENGNRSFVRYLLFNIPPVTSPDGVRVCDH